jgi:predicted permease
LFLRTLLNLRSASLGINPEHIILFEINPPRSRYSNSERIALFKRIAESLASLPSAEKVTMSSEPLLANSMDNDCFHPSGGPAGKQVQNIWTNYVGSGFFETFSIPIVRGRTLVHRDNRQVQKVAVINQQLAKIFFPNANPVGQSISRCGADGNLTRLEIVGVSADAKYSEIRQDPPPTIYFPYTQADDLRSMTFEVKTAVSLGSLTPRMREVVGRVDKDLPLLDVRTQTQQIEATLINERIFATLTSGFGLLALTLSSIGIYGVMAYTVSRRTNEIGIRMALGARATQVLIMVLGETSLLAAAGIVAGLCGAFAATRIVASMLYGMKPTDPLTFAGAAVLLLAVAALASLVPAWRAARVDPVNALRHE